MHVYVPCFCCIWYFFLVLAAFLLNYHLECMEEKDEETRTNMGCVFQPEKTDVMVEMNFAEYGVDFEMDLGLTFMLAQFFPCSVIKLMQSVGLGTKLLQGRYSRHNITIYDARKDSHINFYETGFTLITLPEDTVTADLRSTYLTSQDSDIKKFHAEMELHIRQLYPHVKRLEWGHNVVRGGNRIGDQPPALGHPHLDFHQNDTERVLFHEEYPPLQGTIAELLQPGINNHDDNLEVVLGVWKPLYPASVCDYPLAVMDARTFLPEDQTRNKFHISLGFLTFQNLMTVASFSHRQRWAYYPFQTTREVLVFHHYSKNHFFANPHTSFPNANCPLGWGGRISVETRVALFF